MSSDMFLLLQINIVIISILRERLESQARKEARVTKENM